MAEKLRLSLPGTGFVARDVARERREGLGWGNKTRAPLCRESWRYLIMSLVHPAWPSADGAGRKSQLALAPVTQLQRMLQRPRGGTQ